MSPLEGFAPGPGARAPALAPAAEGPQPVRLLLIEDNPDYSDLVQAMLAATGPRRFIFTPVARLAQALTLASQASYDVALLDLSLPDSLGLETYKRLHSQAPALPIIVMTGNDDEDLALQAVREGAQDYLVKGQTDAPLLARAIRYAIERGQGQQAHHQMEQQFLQAQKMEAVARLAAGIAHDFNSLLTVILACSDTLLTTPALTASARLPAAQIKSAAIRAAGLTEQFLAFSRQQVLQPRLADINGVIAELERLLRPLLGGAINLITILEPALPRVKVDVTKFEQVLLNLAVNARDALPDGGQLTIETRDVRRPDAQARWKDDMQADTYVQIAVTDTGVGMDAETLCHIFEPFFTTKGPGKGSGLGLAAVYGIVRQSGGHIGVTSDPGLGTSFKIHLPYVRQDASPPNGLEPAGLAPAKETVLIVEDVLALRTVARVILETYGYTVLDACGGAEALLLCERHAGPIQLLLTDVLMPVMNGHDLAARLAVIRPETRVLFMSGYADNCFGQDGVPAAGTEFLQKPFTPDSLARRVREVLDAAQPAAV